MENLYSNLDHTVSSQSNRNTLPVFELEERGRCPEEEGNFLVRGGHAGSSQLCTKCLVCQVCPVFIHLGSS
ncbi:mCG147692 [Mus musculus]|nr:mCG147692 [Mus musculus]